MYMSAHPRSCQKICRRAFFALIRHGASADIGHACLSASSAGSSGALSEGPGRSRFPEGEIGWALYFAERAEQAVPDEAVPLLVATRGENVRAHTSRTRSTLYDR